MKTFHTSSWVRLLALLGAFATGGSLAVAGNVMEGLGIIAAAFSSPLVAR